MRRLRLDDCTDGELASQVVEANGQRLVQVQIVGCGSALMPPAQAMAFARRVFGLASAAGAEQ